MQNAQCKMQNRGAGERENTNGETRIFLLGYDLFVRNTTLGYHEIGFRASERLHSFCILHFAFCILKPPDKPQFDFPSTKSSKPVAFFEVLRYNRNWAYMASETRGNFLVRCQYMQNMRNLRGQHARGNCAPERNAL